MRGKFMVVCGTRPEVVKLAPLVIEMRKRGMDCVFASSGQHDILLEHARLSFGLMFDVEIAGYREETMSWRCGNFIMNCGEKFSGPDKPGMVIVQGDTLTAFSVAVSAFLSKIPVAHVEAGLRTHNLQSPYPEEAFRQMISRIASHHFTPTMKAKENLILEGIARDRIHMVGNTGVDGLLRCFKFMSWPTHVPAPSGDDFVVLATCHRRENAGKNMAELAKALKWLSETGCKVHMVRHPNPETMRVFESLGKCVVVDALPYVHMLALLNRADVVVTDSGGLVEECATLGKPCVIFRETTERMEAVDANCAVMRTSHLSVQSWVMDVKKGEWKGELSRVFGDGHASEKICDVLEKLP